MPPPPLTPAQACCHLTEVYTELCLLSVFHNLPPAFLCLFCHCFLGASKKEDTGQIGDSGATNTVIAKNIAMPKRP